MRRVLPLLIAAAALGCSDREHANPLDPGNPLTGGAPPGFVALADDGRVILSWSRVGSSDLSYRLSRQIGAGAFVELAELTHDVSFYLDPGLANGTDYTYRLQYETPEGGLGQSVEETATPGKALPWAADVDARAVLRLTPDARHVADRITAFIGPFDLDVYPANGRLWVCDAGDLYTVRLGDSQPERVGSLREPTAVAVNRSTGDAWVCDDILGALQRFTQTDLSTPAADVRGLGTPLSVGVDVRDGSAWVCERGADRVGHFDVSGAPLGTTPVIAPSRIAVDSLTSNVWVTSLTTTLVVRISGEGTPLDTLRGFTGPIGVAVDNRIGWIWVADAAGNRVFAFDRAGTMQLQVAVAEPHEIAIDLPTGDAWVTLPASGEVERISRTGSFRKLGGMRRPLDVAMGTH